jgi:putative tricarboxylic transport membrane protein
METLGFLVDGFAGAITPTNLLFVFLGCLLGQIVGALPGLGPSAAMAILMPLTFGVPPTTAMIMLAGIMYGGMYGGTLTSVLINVPGEAASVMTAVDGYQLAKQGRAGAALSMAAISSFCGGVAAVTAVVFFTPIISNFALKFNAPEYFLLATMGITATASLGTGSALKALMVGAFGLIIAMIGTDPMSGINRLTFGSIELMDGIDFIPVAIGIFGIGEVLSSLEQRQNFVVLKTRLRDLWLTTQDWALCRMAIVRSGLVGFFVGAMPGTGPTIASLLAYTVQQRASKHPENFGKGALDGVSASEAANSAAAQGALIPMLALGIPGSQSTAVLLAALLILGIRPGPLLMSQQAHLVWTLLASMYIGNIMLLVMNLPLAPVWASILRIPYDYLMPGIIVISLVGTYATTLSLFTVALTIAFGIIGYLMIKFKLPRAPLVLAIVLAPLLGSSLRQSLMLSSGSLAIFIQRPISAVLLLVVLTTLVLPIIRHLRERRKANSCEK